MVSRAGNDDCRTFFVSLLVGEREGDEDNFAKRVNGFAIYLNGRRRL